MEKQNFFNWSDFYKRNFNINKDFPLSSLAGPVDSFVPIIISKDVTPKMMIEKYKELGVSTLYFDDHLSDLQNLRENRHDYIIVTEKFPLYRRQFGDNGDRDIDPTDQKANKGLTMLEGLILLLYHQEQGTSLKNFVLQASYVYDEKRGNLFPYIYKQGPDLFFLPISLRQVMVMADTLMLVGVIREEIIDVHQQAERMLVA